MRDGQEVMPIVPGNQSGQSVQSLGIGHTAPKQFIKQSRLSIAREGLAVSVPPMSALGRHPRQRWFAAEETVYCTD